MQPQELVMIGAAVGLEEAGISKDMFDPAAPLAACRLCGAIYQTRLHRNLHQFRQQHRTDPPELLQKVLDNNNKWRQIHTNDSHTEAEVRAFAETGWFLTPQAAKVLSPFGIFGIGNMHEEIVDAMYEADRAPDLTMLQGGE
jgi:hypothetical protein